MVFLLYLPVLPKLLKRLWCHVNPPFLESSRKTCGSVTDVFATPVFATSSSDRSIVNSFYAGDQLLVVAELTIRAGSELDGMRIRELGQDRHVFVISHSRGKSRTPFPSGEITFAVGDLVTLQTEPKTLKGVHKMNHDPEPY